MDHERYVDFSGGSHYTSDFEEFEKGYISKIIKNYKKKIYSEKIQFIAISPWLKKKLKKASFKKFKFKIN